ncbi:hypothetical protein [Halorubrum trueperi]|uniref:GIY-YIG nuclease family protein n=1 Tax=Halorubrum trueperi TaxID=2004704 RepID=A0ABD5UIZ6_9EURY
MPISKPYTKATEAKIKSKVPQKAGVYELKSFGETKYIGSSKNLQERLLTQLGKDPNGFRFKTAGFLSNHKKMERAHYDRHVEKHGSAPDWNENRP